MANEPDAKKRNGPEALRVARQVCQATDYSRPEFLLTLAVCYAELGRSAEAVTTAKKALALASPSLQPDLRQAIQARLQVYQRRLAAGDQRQRSQEQEIILTSGSEQPGK